jgi:hypothetical protein
MSNEISISLSITLSKLLAEILRLQRWAGGQPDRGADRVFGLTHGFETVIQQEKQIGISEETQRHVEDILQDVDSGEQSTDGMAMKDRLYEKGISEPDAATVMQLCRLQNRFDEAVEKVASGEGSRFGSLKSGAAPEAQWLGALHYIELVDGTDGAKKKLHAVYAACVPRVGELVKPEKGSLMEVINVSHVASRQLDSDGNAQVVLTPYVTLKAIDDDDDDADDDDQE